MSEILPPAALLRAAAALRAGQPVVMPTETVYGLAADATDPGAVAAVFAAKGRPSDDPLIVHVAPAWLGADPVAGLAARGLIDPAALGAAAGPLRLLAAACWPGPLTLVLPRGPAIPGAVTAGLDTVAVRAPRHPLAIALLEATDRPLAAPSANRFGRISPTTAAAAAAELSGRVALILDGGPCEVGLESTVLRLHPDGRTSLLRPGGVPVEHLTALLGVAPAVGGAPTPGPQEAPGQLASHYAPRTPLVLVDGPSAEVWRALVARTGGPIGWLAWTDADAVRATAPPGRALRVHVLAPDGEPATAARRLFALLRALDDDAPGLLVAERPPPGDGLTAALTDRLTRAAAK